MRTNCSQCKQTLDEDGPAMTYYGNEEVYCLCSKECGDKWVYPSDSRLHLEQKQFVVQQRPSDKCGDCVWWYEEPLLCEGCPNNPESEAWEGLRTTKEKWVSHR